MLHTKTLLKQCSTLGFAAMLLAAPMTSFAKGDVTKVPAGQYVVDTTHAYINFQYNHLGLSNPTLSFDEFNIEMNLDNVDPTKTTVSVDIKADSVDTGSKIWHQHITGAKWFDTEMNPDITFKSTSVTGSGSNFKMMGDLTIKDQTKPVTLDVIINAAKNHPMKKTPVVGISATGKLKRSDWGLGANAPYVSDEVSLNIEAEMFAK